MFQISSGVFSPAWRYLFLISLVSDTSHTGHSNVNNSVTRAPEGPMRVIRVFAPQREHGGRTIASRLARFVWIKAMTHTGQMPLG
jgi:hypothetical protein